MKHSGSSVGPDQGVGQDESRFDFATGVRINLGAQVGKAEQQGRADAFENDSYILARPHLQPVALHGIVGQIVEAACKGTEAVPSSVAINLLARFAAIIGRSAHIRIGDHVRYLNFNALIVGPTSKGRKGTSADLPEQLFRLAESLNGPQTPLLQELTALSTGEGLIHRVRDARLSDEDPNKVIDRGVIDKRLLCDISEFAGVLAVATRKDNTITAVLRDAFDGRVLTTPSKTSFNRASGAHVVVVGSIPEAELLTSLSSTDIANGLANRFGMFYSARTKIISDPKPTDPRAVHYFAEQIRQAVLFAVVQGALEMDEDAKEYWDQIYRDLNEATHEPVVQKLLGREELLVRVWSALIALLNMQTRITTVHLDAALAWRQYWQDTLTFVFSTSEKNESVKQMRSLMDRIVETITTLGGKNVRHSDIAKKLTNNYAKNCAIKPPQVKAALEQLQRESPARIVAELLTDGERGRPANAYTLAYLKR